jgi:Ca-activated chloride channel family protein
VDTGKLDRTPDGAVIPTITLQPANYTVLGEMSRLSHGRFFRATNRTELQSIYNEIDRLEKTEIKLRQYTTFVPLFEWPLLAALALFALELLLANTRFRRLP